MTRPVKTRGEGTYSAIPSELRERPQWVLWRLQSGTKKPYQTNGTLAKSSDPATWTTYEKVLAAASDKRRRFGGIGYVFSEDDPYCGVDLDHCMVDGELNPAAADIVRALDSYTEVSPSGAGVHVIARAALENGGVKRNGLEVYDRGRYFTFTGDVLDDSASIEDRQDELNRVLTDATGPNADEQDEETAQDKQTLADLLTNPPSEGNRNLWLTEVAGHYARSFDRHRDYEAHVVAASKLTDPPMTKSEALEVAQNIWGREETKFDKDLTKMIWQLRVREEAQRQLRATDRPLPAAPVPVASMEEIANEAIDWVVSDLLAAGEKAVIAGPPKSLKTWLSLHIAKAIATGARVLDEARWQVQEPQPVLYVQEEGQRQRWARRIASVFEEDRTAPFHSVHRAGLLLLNDTHVDWVAEQAESTGARVIFLDPLQRMMPGVNENDAMETGPVWDAIHNLATRTGAAVIVNHHARKGAGAAMDAIRGTSRVAGEVDLMLVLQKDERGTLECFLDGRELVRADAEDGNLEIKYDADAPHRMRFAGIRLTIKGPVNTTRPAILEVLQAEEGVLDTAEIHKRVETNLGTQRERSVVLKELNALANAGQIVKRSAGRGKPAKWGRIESEASSDA